MQICWHLFKSVVSCCLTGLTSFYLSPLQACKAQRHPQIKQVMAIEACIGDFLLNSWGCDLFRENKQQQRQQQMIIDGPIWQVSSMLTKHITCLQYSDSDQIGLGGLAYSPHNNHTADCACAWLLLAAWCNFNRSKSKLWACTAGMYIHLGFGRWCYLIDFSSRCAELFLHVF